MGSSSTTNMFLHEQIYIYRLSVLGEISGVNFNLWVPIFDRFVALGENR